MNHTLQDGLRIMELLAYSDRPLPLTEIAATLSLGKSKTHRLLQTLIQANYAFQSENAKYLASIKFWELGSAMLRHASLRSMAEEQMQALMERTGESVHLSILEKSEIVYVHKIDSDKPVRAYSQIGGRMPAHLVATGKAILAFQNEQALIYIYNAALQKGQLNGKSQTAFLREMMGIRQTRIAINKGEWRKDVYGVASPIIRHTGNVVAAIGVSGPAHRFQTQHIALFTDEVKRSAVLIAEKLFGDLTNTPWKESS